MENFGYSMLWFWASYVVVTLLGMLHTVFNIFVLKMKPMDDKSLGEGYEKTKPYHPIYNIVLFTAGGYLYLQTLSAPSWVDALLTGIIWFVIAFVIDYIGWIKIKHPWSLTTKQFYVEYQPWITWVYIAIGISPVLAQAIRLMS